MQYRSQWLGNQLAFRGVSSDAQAEMQHETQKKTSAVVGDMAYLCWGRAVS